MLKKLKLKRFISDETGVSLIIALMTLFVLSIIGVTLATVTFANVKLTTTDREYQSAYYIAEAGVNQAYAEIRDEILEIYGNATSGDPFYSAVKASLLGDMFGEPLTNFQLSFGERPEASISVLKIEDEHRGKYKIKSKGRIGQRERTVTKEFTVNWVPKTGPTPMPALPEGVGAIVYDNIRLSGGGTVEGDLYLNSSSEDSFRIENTGAPIMGNLFLPNDRTDSTIYYDGKNDVPPNHKLKPNATDISFVFEWDKLKESFSNFPTAPNLPIHEDVTIKSGSNKHDVIKNGNLYINNYLISNENYILNLDQNYHFYRASFSSNYTLKINVGHEDRILVFDALNLTNGNIEVIGSGNLTIFVKNELTFSSRPKVNNGGNVNQLTLYYEGSEKVEFTTVDINANILIKEADVSMNAGGARTGQLISGGSSVEIFGGSNVDSMIVAPFADVVIRNLSELKGVVIANNLYIYGGPTLRYKQVDTSEFPFDFITVPNVPAPPGGGDTGGLLTPKPNTE